MATAPDGPSLVERDRSESPGPPVTGVRDPRHAGDSVPRPRDFTTGKFKVRTTPNGALPTHQDLSNVLRRGMPYTSMPAWPTLSDQDVSDLSYFIKTFSPDFANPEIVPQPVPLPSAPTATNESIELGKTLYVDNGCVKCHGNLGRGDGPSATTLKDDLGRPIRAADLSQSWTFRGGSSREDIFRTMSTGLNGTPMPSFLDALPPEQRWAIVFSRIRFVTKQNLNVVYYYYYYYFSYLNLSPLFNRHWHAHVSLSLCFLFFEIF